MRSNQVSTHRGSMKPYENHKTGQCRLKASVCETSKVGVSPNWQTMEDSEGAGQKKPRRDRHGDLMTFGW